MTGWQPIETAEKGTPASYRAGPMILGVHVGSGWVAYNIVQWNWHKNAKTGAWKGPHGVWEPTHWMPLPPAPVSA